MSQTDVERANSYDAAVTAAIRGALAGVWTALPGVISSFNAELQTAEVQATIQCEVTASDGKVTLATIPLLLDCPAQFPRGGKTVATFPVAPGDECLVVFAARCIDAWWQNGGVQPQAELRMHDLSDGFVILGVSSKPNVIENLSASAAELRSLDGETVVSLDPDAQTLILTAPGGATINANTTINGDLTVTGAVSFTGPTVTHGGVNIGKTHKHGGVTAGGAQTGVPA